MADLQVCTECGRPMIQQRTWVAASDEQRAAWKAAGAGILQGRGMCGACYQRTRKGGGIPPREAKPAGRCVRCGQPAVAELCVDCTDVTTDMRELARWAS